jgi:hypothetical protein
LNRNRESNITKGGKDITNIKEKRKSSKVRDLLQMKTKQEKNKEERNSTVSLVLVFNNLLKPLKEDKEILHFV